MIFSLVEKYNSRSTKEPKEGRLFNLTQDRYLRWLL